MGIVKRLKASKLLLDVNRADPGGWLTMSDILVLTGMKWREIEYLESHGGFPQGSHIRKGKYRWQSDKVNAWLDARDRDPAYSAMRWEAPGAAVNLAAYLHSAVEHSDVALSPDELARYAIPIADFAHAASGIYFLWKTDRIVYVGQSRNGLARILTHLAEGVKDFDALSFLRCPVGKLDEVERHYIRALLPIYNNDAASRLYRSAFDASDGQHKGDR